MSKGRQTTEPEQLPRLLVPRSKAHEELSAQLRIGEELRGREILRVVEIDTARADRSRWVSFVTLMIKSFISPPQYAKDFEYSSRGFYTMGPSPQERLEFFRDDMEASINELKSVIERLPLIEEPTTPENARKSDSQEKNSKVFVVHGHDEAAREKVARFISRFGLAAR